ncbi:MAG: hypothetical protein NVS3B3_05030 [Aquirhabdus sp.]
MIDPSHKDVQKNKSALQPAEGTVSTLYASSLLDYLRSIGVEPSILFEPTIIADLQESGGIISISRWQMMLEQAVAYTGDVDLPLKVSEQLQPKHFGMLGFLIMSFRTGRDVVDNMLRFGPLISDIHDTILVKNGDYLEAHWVPGLGPSTMTFMQQSLAGWAVMARQITSMPHLSCDVHFSFPQPANIEVYQRIFGGNIYFDAPITKMVAHQSVLDLPITLSDPATNSVLLTQVEKRLQSITQPDFLQQLREYLIAHLASNQVSINDVATAFDISPRTLQNRLTEVGYGYRALLKSH